MRFVRVGFVRPFGPSTYNKHVYATFYFSCFVVYIAVFFDVRHLLAARLHH